MIKTLIIIIILLSAGLTLQSKTKDTVTVNSKKKLAPIKYELGISVGEPVKFNIVGVMHSEDFLWKLSAGYWNYPYGAQADFGVKLSEKEKSYSALCAGIGVIVYHPITKEFGLGNVYNYSTINYITNYYGFVLNFGLSAGTGIRNEISYAAILQVGYTYQFR